MVKILSELVAALSILNSSGASPGATEKVAALVTALQMKNCIGFRADRTLDRKHGGVITYIKAAEAVDAEQLIAKSNSYVEYQLIRIKRNIVIINV